MNKAWNVLMVMLVLCLLLTSTAFVGNNALVGLAGAVASAVFLTGVMLVLAIWEATAWITKSIQEKDGARRSGTEP